jgi:transposase
MPARTSWPPEMVEVLKKHLADGFTYAQIAKAMGKSRGGVATAVRAYVQGVTDERTKRKGRDALRWKLGAAAAGMKSKGQPHRWTDDVLTEPYAARKLRKQIEASR